MSRAAPATTVVTDDRWTVLSRPIRQNADIQTEIRTNGADDVAQVARHPSVAGGATGTEGFL